jgi:dTDP-4-amino-4,6-dideoxygalactose transaminase
MEDEAKASEKKAQFDSFTPGDPGIKILQQGPVRDALDEMIDELQQAEAVDPLSRAKIQLKRLEEFTAKRIGNAGFLNKSIRIKGLTTPFLASDVRHVYHQYVVRIEDGFPASRERLLEYLQARGIGSAVHYPKAVYEQPLYQSMGREWQKCPVAEDVSRRVLSLPVHPSLQLEDLDYIAETINGFEA